MLESEENKRASRSIPVMSESRAHSCQSLWRIRSTGGPSGGCVRVYHARPRACLVLARTNFWTAAQGQCTVHFRLRSTPMFYAFLYRFGFLATATMMYVYDYCDPILPNIPARTHFSEGRLAASNRSKRDGLMIRFGAWLTVQFLTHAPISF
ncbi:hypothetical protein EDB84DRAFT_558753 [Lactarius hengduanensis]|nr:hypothetical protein EDB84DRAFT_558753 [Lactarius hengduanensis]